MFVFIIASSMSLPIGYTSGHDSWISAILGGLAGLCIAWIYVKLCSAFPQKSIIHIAQTLLGTWAGKVVGILYTWYAFELGSYVLRNFEDLTVTVLLPRTPVAVISLIMIAVASWAAYQGIEVICRCALILVVIVIVQITLFTVLVIPEMDPGNLLPIFETSWRTVFDGAAQIATFPLGETVLFVMIIPFINRIGKTKKTVLTVVGAAGFVLMNTHFINILVLGELSNKQVFPSYTTAMYISVGDFFERIEPLVFIIWMYGEFMKLTVCLFAASLALAQTIGSRNYRVFILPLGLALVELSMFLHPSQLDVIEFQKHVWPWLSMPFQWAIPLLLLFCSFIRRSR